MANTTCLIILLSIFSIGNVLSSSSPPSGCKYTTIARYGFFNKPFWGMNNPSLQHVTYQRSGYGTTHFEMNISVRSQDVVTIMLSHQGDKVDYHNDVFYFIKFTPSTLILSKRRNPLNTIYSNDLTSWNHFTQFYIKIADDCLQFGKHGHSPFFSYKDPGVRTLQYFTFGGGNTDNSKPTQIYFDCP